MAQYKVITRTKSFNKPGINPTTKNGTDMGWVEAGFIFTPRKNQNGWLAILDNKWVMASVCRAVAPAPLPTSDIYNFRRSTDGGATWDEGEFFVPLDVP